MARYPNRAPVDRTTYQHFCAKQRQRVRASLKTLDLRLQVARNDHMGRYMVEHETDIVVRGIV